MVFQGLYLLSDGLIGKISSSTDASVALFSSLCIPEDFAHMESGSLCKTLLEIFMDTCFAHYTLDHLADHYSWVGMEKCIGYIGTLLDLDDLPDPEWTSIALDIFDLILRHW